MASGNVYKRGIVAIALAVACAGCEDAALRDGLQPPAASASPTVASNDLGEVRAHLIERDDPAMLAAMAQARETADEARTRWQASPESARMRWAVKWAAPNESSEADDEAEPSVEYVWVLPLHWSPFRVEGILASDPIMPLACKAREGDLVSFSIEELADWVYINDEGAIEGGFTAAVIAARHGHGIGP
ncbi:MAG TPA: DUF2314 domain-containing protein [Phycisphaerales bacterium]|nr:DUF2314 domain-containing protein [Phycisphaerales bacterium]HRQ75857.1 DUF2314 domain-containing protein [Phycisphaerales bacterium]